MKLSGFADEISPDLFEQVRVLGSLGMQYVEIRSVWKKNILTMSDEEWATVKAMLDQHGIRVSAIASRIGKDDIGADPEQTYRELERAIEAAGWFGTPYIRIFSFSIPRGDEADRHRHAVLARMKVMTERAEQAGVILLLENETGMFGDVPERCRDLLHTTASPCLKLAFDSGNFRQGGVQPTTDAYPQLASFIAYVHVKDIDPVSLDEVPPGDGDAELDSLLRHLNASGYDGFLSLEPHLRNSDYRPDLTHEELFTLSANAFKEMLARNKISWE